MFKRSIKWRFILPSLLILIAAGVGLSVYFSQTYTNSYYEDTREYLTAEANLLAAEVSLLPIGEGDPQSLQTIAERYADKLNARVTIILPDGEVVAESEYESVRMENHLDRPEIKRVLAGGTGYSIRFSETSKTKLLYVAVGQERNGTLERVIRLAKPLTVVEARVKDIRKSIFIGGIIAIMLTFLLSFLAARKTTEPIVKLTQAANGMAEGDFSLVPEPRADNEITDLTRAFSLMADQIQQQIETIGNEKKKLEKIVDRLMDGIIIVTRDGKIELMNQAAGSMFGVKSTNVEGQAFIKTMQLYQLVELWQNTLKNGKDQSSFIEFKAREKYLFGMSTFLSTVREGTILILIQDRTKNRQLENMRRNFVSNVSHELRTPLTTMKALTETLQQCIGSDPQSAQHFLNLMDVEIDKLTQMVLELLDLSRIESGRVEMNKISVNVLELLTPPVERMKLQADRAHVDLKVDCLETLPAIYVDAEQMERVLLNIIHNAIKYTSPGGSIILSAEVIGQEMVIKINDTGEGISEQDLPHIFERFYKTDQARSSGGTGLGLAIAKHIVEAHQGRIWVESKKGFGSTFFIALPLT